MRDLALKARVRNCLRAVGWEVVPTQLGTNLLGVHLEQLFSAYDISCVLDVGAHRGQYGKWLRKNGYRGDIVSFEPVLANFQILERVAAGDRRWHCFNYALGAENTVASINVTTFSVFSSFRKPNATARAIFGQTPAVQRSEEVEIRRLDTVVDTLPVDVIKGKTYLKLDTQGWDLEVVAGAQGVLDRIIALQTEAAFQTIYEGMPAISDSLTGLAQRGFMPSGFFPVSYDPRLALVEVDLVAVRGADNVS